MATVHFFGGQREWYRPVIVEEEELFLSPMCHYETATARFRPPGPFNVADILATLPSPYCRPDLVTVMYDEASPAEGLAQVEAKKVLFVGDTHHGERPIEKRVKAALAQPWDLVVTEFCPQHLRWFDLAGEPRAAYIPCFNINPRKIQPTQNRTRGLVFVGQTSDLFPRRKYVLAELQRRGYPVLITQCHQQQAAELYNTAAACLNISLNGDLNLRGYEIMAAGGTQIEDPVNMPMHDVAGEVEWFLTHPDYAFKKAVEDYAFFWASHAPASKIFTLHAILKTIHPGRHPCPETLWPRIAAYEALQERQRLHVADEPLEVVVADQQTADDASTLTRLKVRVG